ncbi:MAG: 4-(cytidine 5'-diphospho)-2-C-methyl-D-erythritol kinase, partial [Acetanaerobacterium sp.]
MDECRVMAPAKINLSLDITGRRHDGYHLLRTVLQSIRLCDHLLLQRTDNGIITLECDCHDLPTGADNLAVRAAQAFFTYHKLTDAGVRITLEKNIPMQAGLAGGSADAAA